tara:strand:+ start:68217 stop:69200 length:984 start_codon:yes stop_codon:yes gene_type:complete
MSKVVLITGAAGFIGCATSLKLLSEGHTVIGVDCLNDYYDVSLKKARLERLEHNNFHFHKVDIANMDALKAVFEQYKPSHVINLAAQAGVRYSLENPGSYAQSNMVGFVNVLECCRYLKEGEFGFEHLVYASSSSVYGGNEKTPFEETDEVCDPRSLYAASKRSNELMAHTYANLFKLNCSGLRFFTVYGEWGRPDMSPMLFAKNILNGNPIKVYNHGDLWRDFTYVGDIVEGVTRLLWHIPTLDIPAEIYNIGNSKPVQLLEYIKTMEKVLGKEAILDLQPWPPTEVYQTYASTKKLEAAVGYKPNTDLEDGLRAFASWYKTWHKN